MYFVRSPRISNEINLFTNVMSRLIKDASSSLEMVAEQCSSTVSSLFVSDKAKASEEKVSHHQDEDEEVIWFLPQEEFQDSSIILSTPLNVCISSDDSFVKSTYEEEVNSIFVNNFLDVFMHSFTHCIDSSFMFVNILTKLFCIIIQPFMYICGNYYNLFSYLIYRVFKTPKLKMLFSFPLIGLFVCNMSYALLLT